MGRMWNVMSNSPISLALFALWSELDQVNALMMNMNRSNVRIILYVVDDRTPLSEDDNCLHRYNTVNDVN